MGTKERLEILNEKYMAQENFDNLIKNAKVKITRIEEPIKLYSQQDYEEKDKTINELLKRISELEFEVEEKDRRIDKAIEYVEENLQPYENNLPIIAIDYQNVIFLLKGEDKK